jgi:hypothetical protein
MCTCLVRGMSWFDCKRYRKCKTDNAKNLHLTRSRATSIHISLYLSKIHLNVSFCFLVFQVHVIQEVSPPKCCTVLVFPILPTCLAHLSVLHFTIVTIQSHLLHRHRIVTNGWVAITHCSDWFRAVWLGFDSCRHQLFFLFKSTSRPALRPTQLIIQCILWDHSSGSRSGRDVNLNIFPLGYIYCPG